MIRLDETKLRAMPGFAKWEAEAREALDALLAEHAKLVKDHGTLRKAFDDGWSFVFDSKVWQHLKNDILREFANKKCMYCEGIYDAGAHDDGEHYRPKNEVCEAKDHPGYFWLAYAWQNILLSCIKCNRPPAKGTHFPIEKGKQHIDAPGAEPKNWWKELEAETPLLLHPYFDEPSKHLKVGKHGALIGKTDRGRETIKICDLNRAALCEERERECEHIYGRARERLQDFSRTGNAVHEPLFSGADRYSFYLNAMCFAAFS